MGTADGDERGRGNWSMVGARWALGALVGGTLFCLAVALTPDPNPPLVPPPGATTDLDAYRTVVTRVARGDSYYDAAQLVLRSHGYPTRSIFNWRTPCYAWFLGRVTGDDIGRALLIVGVLMSVAMACRDLLSDCGLVAGSVGGVAFVGATAWCFDRETFLFTELWAAMLIALSACALRRGWMALGVSLGIAAVFYRELAFPYALAALALAAWEGRRREALGWAIGLALFAAFMAGHAWVVHARLTAADMAVEASWLRFGGARFLLATAQANVFVAALPPWATALYLPAACLGLVGMRGESGRRIALTAALYVGAFAVAGNPFNFYWGFVDAPLLALGVGHAPGVLRELVAAALPVVAQRGIATAPDPIEVPPRLRVATRLLLKYPLRQASADPGELQVPG